MLLVDRSGHVADDLRRLVTFVFLFLAELFELRIALRTALGFAHCRLGRPALLELGVAVAIVKRGPAGVLARTADGVVEIDPVPCTVVNGLGAGDAFGGALVHALLAGWSLEDAIRFANAAGSFVAARFACADAMPTIEDLAEHVPAVRA